MTSAFSQLPHVVYIIQHGLSRDEKDTPTQGLKSTTDGFIKRFLIKRLLGLINC